jgi:ribosomal protein L16 Arg81 hydroxylase
MPFAELVAPLAVDKFISDYWTRRAVHLFVEGRTFADRFGWDGVNAILNARGLGSSKVRVVLAGNEIPESRFSTSGDSRAIDPHAVLGWFDQGATLVLTQADSHWPPLAAVVRGVQDFFLEDVNVNVYCSPGEIQGVDCHYDLHEVFVLQVEGAKRWKIFEPTVDAPLARFRKEDAPTEDTTPYLDVVLRKGEVLYVPRGHWHYAVADGSASVHVTIGVRCRTGKTFLDWLAGELSTHACWRQNLPLADRPVDDAWAAQLKRSLVDKLGDPDLFDRFRAWTRDNARVAAEVNAPYQIEAEDVPIDALRFARPAGRRPIVTEGEPGQVTVSSAGSELALEGVDASLLRQLFAEESFTAADVARWRPGVNMDDVAGLLTAFVKSGLLLASRD